MDSDPEPVTPEHLLSSYIVRVAERGGRWQITVQDLRSGVIRRFASFDGLLEHLEGLLPERAQVSKGIRE